MFTKHIHYSQELESSILGAIMLETTAFGRVYGILKKEVFYFEANQILYENLNKMWEENLPCDMVSVTLFLYKNNITKLGGFEAAWYTAEQTRCIVSTASLEYHSLILRQMYVEREMTKLTTGGMKSGVDALKYMDDLQNQLMTLRQIKAVDDFKPMDELLIKLSKHMDNVRGKELVGASTGFKELDRITGGLQPGNVYIVAARPSVGKSAFMGKMVIAAAQKDYQVSVLSLEMSDVQITARMGSLVSEIDYWRIYRDRMIDEDQRADFYNKVNSRLLHLPIYVSDTASVDLGDVKSKVARQRQKGQADIVFIDYLQLIEGDEETKNRNREQEVAKMSRGLKLLAKQFEVPIVVLAQLNRVSETTGDKKPKLHNLRESGSIEADADGVIFLHRDWMSGIKSNDDGSSTENEAHIIIAKWREGELTEIKIGFDGAKMKFYELGDLQPHGSGGYSPTLERPF